MRVLQQLAGSAWAGRDSIYMWTDVGLQMTRERERERDNSLTDRTTSRQLTTELSLISRSIAFPRVLWPSPTVNDIRYLRFGALKRDRDDRIVYVIHVITFEMGKWSGLIICYNYVYEGRVVLLTYNANLWCFSSISSCSICKVQEIQSCVILLDFRHLCCLCVDRLSLTVT